MMIAAGRKKAVSESLRKHIRKLRNGQIGNQGFLESVMQIAKRLRRRGMGILPMRDWIPTFAGMTGHGRDARATERGHNHVPDEMSEPGHAKGESLRIIDRFGLAGEQAREQFGSGCSAGGL